MPRLKVTQVRSKVGYSPQQRDTLRSLGLKRINDVVVKEDRPEIDDVPPSLERASFMQICHASILAFFSQALLIPQGFYRALLGSLARRIAAEDEADRRRDEEAQGRAAPREDECPADAEAFGQHYCRDESQSGPEDDADHATDDREQDCFEQELR